MSPGGFCNPVRRKCPNPPRWPQACRIGFHMPRINCHSPRSRTPLPRGSSLSLPRRRCVELRIRLGTTRCRRISDRSILPHPRGPSRITAGDEARISATSWPTTLFKWPGLPALGMPPPAGKLLHFAEILHSTCRALRQEAHRPGNRGDRLVFSVPLAPPMEALRESGEAKVVEGPDDLPDLDFDLD